MKSYELDEDSRKSIETLESFTFNPDLSESERSSPQQFTVSTIVGLHDRNDLVKDGNILNNYLILIVMKNIFRGYC